MATGLAWPMKWAPRLFFSACMAAALFVGAAADATLDDANAAFDRKDFSAAVKLYRSLADHGDAAAQNALGGMYEQGQGLPRSYGEALKWYRKAADQNYARAQANVASIYELGKGVSQDYGEALKWYRKAAEQGDVVAQNALGAMTSKGQGVVRDDAEAARWYAKAAELGFAPAQNNLGAMYGAGQGVPKDDAEAIKWRRRAVNQGYGAAQVDLGLMYLNGQSVKKDYAEAFKLFKKAADQGLAVAQYNVGLLYYKGEGFQQNDAEAAKWFKLAAEQGYDVAQFQIGEMYAQGRGVAKDGAAADKWYKIAASQGNAEAIQITAAQGPRLAQTVGDELRDIMDATNSGRPRVTDLRQCTLKGFHPGMTGKEYSDNFFGQLTKEQKNQINLKQPETLAMAACESAEHFTQFKQISKGMSLYYNQPDNFVRFIYQNESFESCCSVKDSTIVLPHLITNLLFDANSATMERFAKDFSNTYNISMELFDDKSGHDALSYRNIDSAAGCQIEIKADLSIHIKAIPKSVSPGASRAGNGS
ncbi:MAG: SEL1-like repeat protein [Desulfovibrionaceae bacterium]|nr:SEL1-like repeat protein [Desulfovibrionaceae bacterium]MBF0514204.1 SEL1-like repeat protein [Desulfovibrionaceae bacterium]